MKNKKIWLIAGIAAAVLLAGVLIIAVISGSSKPAAEPTETEESESAAESEITVPDISRDTETDDETDDDIDSETILKEDIDPDSIIKLDESEVLEETEPEVITPSTVSVETDEVVQPVAVKEPKEDPEEKSPTIIIGGGDTEEAYSCGVANHHCEGPETHAYISNLELQGCKYCGSHSCPSFYGTDEWGNAQYTPSLCPMYGVEKDPLNYCQICGKPTGDGTNGTCVHYIQECDCPNCGEHVGSRECHTCE